MPRPVSAPVSAVNLVWENDRDCLDCQFLFVYKPANFRGAQYGVTQFPLMSYLDLMTDCLLLFLSMLSWLLGVCECR